MIYNSYPRDFLETLMLNNFRELHSKIEILDWQERSIGEIQGKITDGSLSIDGNSAVRRTISLNIIVDNSNYNITSLKNEVSFNKKIRAFMGMTNTVSAYKFYGDVIWFPLGVFVLTENSIGHNISDNSMSIAAQDKMCLLSGDVAGELQAPVELHRESYYDETSQSYQMRDMLIHDIIRKAVIGLGGEDPAKVIVNDVPLEYKQPLRYMGSTTKYFNADGNELTDVVDPVNDSRIVRVLNPGDFAGYSLLDMTYPTEFIKQAGDSVMSILDDIKHVLGNYEYFYDVNGNFVFQEVKNYMNTTFTPLTQLDNGNYVADFSKVPYIYSFKEKNIVNSFHNTPDPKNIKNDFVVWGMRPQIGDLPGSPIMYHLAIDNKPFLPPTYEKPWQQFLVEYGDGNLANPGNHYYELKAKLPQIYDSTTNQWKGDPSEFNYYFDIIDSRSELGKFSVGNIGRRTKSIVDENVSMMYPPEIPDIIILPTGTSMDYINHLITIGMKFQIVTATDYEQLYKKATGVGKDAFTVIRELLYFYTTFNEVINISCLPLYFLEANHRIEAEDARSNISGDYVIKSMSIPLSAEGLMTISAIRVSQRI